MASLLKKNYVEAFKPGVDHSASKNDEMFLSEIFFMRGRDVLVFLKKWTKLCVKMLMKWYEPYETRSTQIPVCRLVGSFCASHDVCKSLWKASWTFACRKAEKPSTSFRTFFWRIESKWHVKKTNNALAPAIAIGSSQTVCHIVSRSPQFVHFTILLWSAFHAHPRFFK